MACEMAIGRVLDCGIDESACSAWIAPGAPSREDIEAGLLDGCAASPALAVLVNNFQGDCAALVATLSGANADFNTSCNAQAPACEPDPSAYPGEGWDACISDGGSYVLAGASAPSSIARVQAFESMGDLLWRNANAPSSDDFIDAQLIFTEDEGLGSRVSRRYDSHIPQPAGEECRDPLTSVMHPEFCVGPEGMLPIINDAFDAGIGGMEPRLNAARIEAANIWFFYVSIYKEANTCKGKAADCDSSWAYSGAGETVDAATAGFATMVKAANPDAWTALFNAHLAVRCWRDLDQGDPASNDALQQQALAQLDRATDFAYAEVIAYVLAAYRDAPAAEQPIKWEILKIIGPTIDRAARAQDAALADALRAGWSSASPDADAMIGALNTLFPCP